MGTFNAGAIEATITVDRSPFTRGLAEARRQARRFEADDIERRVTLDADTFEAQLARLRAELEAWGRNSATASAGLDVDGGGAQAQIDQVKAAVAELRAQLAVLDRTEANPEVELDGGAAVSAELARLKAQLAAFGATRATATAGVDTSSMGGGMSPLLAGALAAAPVIAPVMGAATGAVGGLTAALTAAGGAAGVFAAAIVGNVKRALTETTPDAKAFQAEIEHAKDAWGGFLEKTEATSLAVASKGVRLFSTVIGELAPVANAVGRSVNDMLQDVQRWADAGGLKSMVDYLQGFGVEAFDSLGRSTGKFVLGLGRLLAAFTPVADQLIGGIDSIADRFDRWSAGLATNKGFQDFIDYTLRMGPKVMDLLGGIGGTFLNIGRAVAPWGELVLDGLIHVFDFLAGIDPQHLGLIGGALIAVAGAFALFAGGPVGGAIAVIGGLGIALSNLYQSSDKFRTMVDAMVDTFQGMAADMAPTVAWIKDKVATAWRDDLQPALEDIADIITTRFLPAWEELWPVIQPAVSGLLKFATSSQLKQLGFTLDLIAGGLRLLAFVFETAVGNILAVKAAFESIGDTLDSVQQWFADLPGNIGRPLAALGGTVSRQWGKVKRTVTAPLKAAVINTVAPSLAARVLARLVADRWRSVKKSITARLKSANIDTSSPSAAARSIARLVADRWRSVRQSITARLRAAGIDTSSPSAAANSIARLVAQKWASIKSSIGRKLRAAGVDTSAITGALSSLYDTVVGWMDKIATAAARPIKVGSGVVKKGLSAIVPGLATGGTVTRSGLVWVGERGPELMSLPGGARVFNHDQSQRIARTRTYDAGGQLEPGWTLAYNGTGHQERIRTREQEEALVAALANARPITIQTLREPTAAELMDRLDFEERRAGRGGVRR